MKFDGCASFSNFYSFNESFSYEVPAMPFQFGYIPLVHSFNIPAELFTETAPMMGANDDGFVEYTHSSAVMSDFEPPAAEMMGEGGDDAEAEDDGAYGDDGMVWADDAEGDDADMMGDDGDDAEGEDAAMMDDDGFVRDGMWVDDAQDMGAQDMGDQDMSGDEWAQADAANGDWMPDVDMGDDFMGDADYMFSPQAFDMMEQAAY